MYGHKLKLMIILNVKMKAHLTISKFVKLISQYSEIGKFTPHFNIIKPLKEIKKLIKWKKMRRKQCTKMR